MSTRTLASDMDELAGSIRSIRQFLVWLVESSDLVDSRHRERMVGVLPDIVARLQRVERQLTEVRPGSAKYRKLALHGLTSEHLFMKSEIGKSILADIKAAAPQTAAVAKPKPKGLLGKLFAIFLDWANTLLGSLSAAFPPLGAVQEFKECVEITVDFAAVVDAPPDEVVA